VTWVENGQVVAQYEHEPVIGSLHKVTDAFGERDNTFDVVHVSQPVPLNGPYGASGRDYVYKNFTPGYFGIPEYPSPVEDGSRPSNYYLAVQLLSKTNPSGSVIDVPVSLVELRELPDLVRRFGNTLLERIASGNLKYEFGVKPMIGDIKALLDFQNLTDNRLKLLKSMQRSPMVRKASLWSGSVSEAGGYQNLQSTPPFAWLDSQLILKTTTRQVWGYATWTPSDALNKHPLSDENLRNIARRAVYGLTVDAYTAWNLIPWSWLVDWFGNIGDYLSSQRRIIDIYPSTPSICETSTTTELYRITNSAPLGVTMSRTVVRKGRAKASAAFPSAYLPLLTGRQVGILSSLAALRSR